MSYWPGNVIEGAGEQNKYYATRLERDIIKRLSEMKDPRVNIFTEKIDDMSKIYHHTGDIYVDKNRVYLSASE